MLVSAGSRLLDSLHWGCAPVLPVRLSDSYQRRTVYVFFASLCMSSYTKRQIARLHPFLHFRCDYDACSEGLPSPFGSMSMLEACMAFE